MKNRSFLFVSLLLLSCNSSPTIKKTGEPKGSIAFTTNRDGNYEVYTMNAKGEKLKNISNHEALEYGSSWSPDGKSVLCYSKRDDNAEIYQLFLDGRSAKRLTNNPAHDVLPAFSPDGKLIAFMSDRNGKSSCLYVMKRDGSEPRALTDNDAYEESPSWSPDGKQILFTRQFREEGDSTHAANGEVFLINVTGKPGEAKRLTKKKGYDSGATFSPDGKQIAFYGTEGETWDIFLMKNDGSELVNLTRDSTECYSPSWSPNGQWITYTAGAVNNYDIWIINPDNKERRKLTDTEIRNEAPAWRLGN